MKKKNRKNRKSINLADYCQQLKEAIEIKPTKDSFVGTVKSLVTSLKVLLQLRPCKIVQCKEVLTGNATSLVIQKLTVIQAHIIQSGYSRKGTNQTKENEEVTNHTVYLGSNGSDIAMNNVHFWLSLNESENRQRAFKIISAQAQQFINSHIIPVIKAIEEIGPNAQFISVPL